VTVAPLTAAGTTPAATAPAIRTLDLVKVHGHGDAAVRALDGVSLQIEQGRFTAIMGPSGSGKSTLLHCVAGLDSITSGQVWLGDVEITSMAEKQLTLLRRERIGFIFQSFNLVPTLSAEDNITLPLAIAGRKPDPAWFAQVIDAMALRPRLHHRPSELSGGQQQRVAAARALVSRPHIIFADEPTGNLDSRSGSELLDFLRGAVRDFSQTIVMVTHDAAAAVYSDRVIFLADGRVVHDIDKPTVDGILDLLRTLGG